MIPFFAFAPEVRNLLYTTNAIKSQHSRVRVAQSPRTHPVLRMRPEAIDRGLLLGPLRN